VNVLRCAPGIAKLCDKQWFDFIFAGGVSSCLMVKSQLFMVKPIAIDHPHIKRFLVFTFFFHPAKTTSFDGEIPIQNTIFHMFSYVFLSSVSSLVGLEMSGVCQPRPSRDGGLNTGIRGITT
jgi:hypothetical protein